MFSRNRNYAPTSVIRRNKVAQLEALLISAVNHRIRACLGGDLDVIQSFIET